MEPSERNAFRLSWVKYRTRCTGLTDWTISGAPTILPRPSTASVTNQTTMIGPNTRPIAPVPRLCARKSTIRMTNAIGMTQSASDADTSSRPSTALSTEIAGVITPSP